HPLDDAGVLAYMERAWNDASLKNDPSWTERNYAFDASDISSRTGGIMTKAQAVADARTDKTVYQSLDLSELNVRTVGNTALVTAAVGAPSKLIGPRRSAVDARSAARRYRSRNAR